MIRLPCLFALLLLMLTGAIPAHAQWTVSTPVPGPAGIEDGLVIDDDGNLFVSTYDGTAVRRIAPDGEVSIHAAGFSSPNGLALGADGTLYVTNAGSSFISRVLPDGTIEHQFITGMQNPAGVAVDPSGTWLYVAQYQASRITRVRLDDVSVKEIVASGFPLNGPVGLDFDSEGHLLAGNFNNGTIIRVTETNHMEAIASIPSYMGFLTVSGSDIYATSYSTNRIYHIDATGEVQVIAGANSAGSVDGPGSEARFNGPNGIVASSSGDTLYVSDYGSESLRMLVRDASSTSVEGVPEYEGIELDIWPNPFQERVTIAARGERISTLARLDVVDMQGRQVHSLPLNRDVVEWNGLSSDGHRLPNGLYFVRLHDGRRMTLSPVMLIR